MKSFFLAVLIALSVLLSSHASYGQSVAITEMLGADVDCTGCPAPVLASISVPCNGSVNCPEALNADPSSASNLYGVNSTCVLSTNGGTTWSQCISQPPTTGGATLGGIAATTNGTVISAASTGTACVIGRSINATTSWSTVFNTTPICQPDPGNSSVRCAGIVCVIATNQGGKMGILTSTDDGQNWVVSFTSTLSGLPFSLYWDGTTGIYQSNNRTSDSLIFTTTGVNGWLNTPNALAISTCTYVANSPSFGPVTLCESARNRRLVNVANGTITALTIPNSTTDTFAKFLAFNGNHYETNQTSPAGCDAFAGAGAATSLVELTCSSTFTTVGGELIGANGKIYITTRSNGVNAVFKVIQ